MNFVKTVCGYVVMGAATALGWMLATSAVDPYKRAMVKQKFTNITNKFKKGS